MTPYTKPLFILPFDHRASFMKKMFGIEGRAPTPEETQAIAGTKMVVYEGFKQAVEGGGVPKESAAVLVDEQFGDVILRDAHLNGFTTALCTEKSGQDEFDFEYGAAFAEHIEKYKPTFVKSLVRYNPEEDAAMNVRQRERLKQLADYCHQHGYYFLIEPLIPAIQQQLERVLGDAHRYETELRPRLAVRMVKEFQDGGVDVDVWKIEGMEERAHYEEFMAQARSNGRDGVTAIVLGRGADVAQVETWLNAGASVDGIIGFAIGRTIFWDAVKKYKNGVASRAQAAEQIANNYRHFYKVFTRT